jgi:LPXTG-motif cell wall-anchored protein
VKKIAATGLVVMTLGLIAILGAFVPTAAAQVATQGAGKARTLTLTVDNIAINSGARLIVTARSNGACQFLLEWNGIRRIQRAGEKFRTTFVAPDVTSLTKIVVHGTCFYTAPRPPQLKSRPGSPRRVGNTDAQTFEVFVPPSLQRSVTVTVLPAGTVINPPGGDGGGTGLPNTGGPNLWFLMVGLIATILGALTARFGRRRQPTAGIVGAPSGIPFLPGL